MKYLNIFIKDDKGSLNGLPYPTNATTPIFCWNLPTGIVQVAFCLEIKTRTQTTLSDGTIGYAYYNSSIITSPNPEHKIPFEMFPNVWSGIIEIRLRIFNEKEETIYSTHEETEHLYPFETIPQGRKWDSTFDGYYFLFDAEIENISGTITPLFQWRNVEDPDNNQNISYQLQWGKTPLFLDGVWGNLGLSKTKTIETSKIAGANTTVETVIDVEGALFYRVRAFDGLDYGEWSRVNAFLFSPSSAPHCYFNFIETNCSSDDPNVILRQNGEIEISFKIVDTDTNIVSAFLQYKLDDIEYPCSLESSTAAVPTNEDISVTWLSARQLPNKQAYVYLYLYAYDGKSESEKIVWQYPIFINNKGIGFGYSDSTNDKLNYRMNGGNGVRSYESFIQLPKEKTTQNIDGSFSPTPYPSNNEFSYWLDWGIYWKEKLWDTISKYKYTPADSYGFIHTVSVKRENWNIYDGYDDKDSRTESAKLFLEYQDEFNERKKDKTENFYTYFNSNMSDYYSGSCNLGRGISSISYFLKPAQYGKGFRIRRPNIVHAETSGLYIDGSGINNSVNDYFGNFNGNTPPEIEELKKKFLWSKFYQFDPMYQPNVKIEETVLGPKIEDRIDYEGCWYWNLFEYSFELKFPFSITRNKNDKFAYRYNGQTYTGSILSENENHLYFTWSSSFSSKLKAVFEHLFPRSIFKEISKVNTENSRHKFTVYSLWNDINKYFQFVETENNCYSIFQIDLNKRYSCRTQFSRVDSQNGHVLKKYLGDSKLGSIKYEVPIDSGNCIGNSGEINSTEPLFTCDPIHVNKYGCHYKYTKERYAASGKVYVRKYFVKPVYMVESQEPIRELLDGELSAPAMGYRNYKLKYSGKNSLGEDLFVKEEIPGRIGGLPAISKLIPVIFEQNKIEEQGWWKAGTNINDPKGCISHKYNLLEDGSIVYFRLPPSEFIKNIGFQDCFCSEYVDLEEAWEKPFYDVGQFVERINKQQPFNQNGEIPQGYIQYILGAYKPPKNQKIEISPYDYKFISGVEAEEGLILSRYNQYWDDSKSSRFSEKQGTVVDPLLIEPKGFERSFEKWGYVPDNSLQTYFKKDEKNIWKDRIIPANNSYVHDLLLDNDISFRAKSSAHLFKKIISDVNKITLPPSEGVKQPFWDFRSKGNNPLEVKSYYSALPQNESPAYQKRPPEIYGEDRPLRISGYIDSMSSIVNWKFLYLQTEWNSYNLIHWEGDQDENIYAKLEVAEIYENDKPSSFMSVKTKDSEWFEKYSCWLIPFVKMKQSDFIDTLNGTFFSIENGIKTQHNFQNDKRYQFRISGLNINSGSYNEPVTSKIFTYSKEAYSPPIVTNIEYDKWKREFAIEFRFDDVHGRKYDIINFYYATYNVGESSPPDSSFKQLGSDILEGNIIDLESNILGDNVVSESQILKHKVYVSADVLGDVFGKNIRFRLESIASEDREGMTAPVFRFSMWTNEFLQKADKKIAQIAGSKNRWAYKTEINEEGKVEEKWVYLPEEEAVIVPGTLSIQNAIITEIESKFENWYYTVAKFEQPSFDAKYHYLCTTKKENELYNLCFDNFIEQYNLKEEWDNYKLEKVGKSESYLKPIFLVDFSLFEEFSFFWDNKAYTLIPVLEGFSDWFEENRTFSHEEVKPLFLRQEKYYDEYSSYLKDNSLFDNDETRTNYIIEKVLQEDFETYYILFNHYPDGRYDDRKNVIYEKYQENYNSWLQNPINAYGEEIDSSLLEIEDEAFRLFLAHDKNIWKSFSYTNKGKQEAEQYFLSASVNGVTYGQQLQTANVQINNDQKLLAEAYRDRNHYETIHRRKLVAKGYFSNGWKNNHPYIGDQKNEIFRFRVENQPATGKINKNYTPTEPENNLPEISTPLAGYDTRWDVYFHFQMDFFDSFDSQNGKPLRDYLWQRLDCSGYAGSDIDSIEVNGEKYIRIMGAIEADSGGMNILPNNIYNPNYENSYNSPTTNDPYSFQLSGSFSIVKSELPGELDTDIIPENWNTNELSKNDDFNQLYFWRVCPYNVLERPVLEKESCRINQIEYFGKSLWYENEYWKVSGENNCFGNAKFSTIAGYHYDYYGEHEHYIWVSTNKLSIPLWKVDTASACWNEVEPYYQNFFHGTNSERIDEDYSLNPIRPHYRERITHGEIIFLTDRPRELVNGKLSYVQDETNDHFKSLWIPFNTERTKPWIIFDENASNSWLMISQKLSKTQNGIKEYVFTLSRGLSPQTFGEECQLFPQSTMDSVKDIIENSVSFESPCLLKVNKHYILYFNVRKTDNSYEIWWAQSNDLYSWNSFSKIETDGFTIFDPAVYYSNEKYTMFGIHGSSIVELESNDGLNFTFVKNIVSETYNLSRPTCVGDKIFFGMNFNGKGKIISINKNIGYDSMVLEKGSTIDIENGHQFNSADNFFNPFVFEDYDKGMKIIRLVYESDSEVYAYVNKKHQKTNIKERIFFTEYLEEYVWNKVYLNSGDYYNSYIEFSNGIVHPIIKDHLGNSVEIWNSVAYVPIGKFEILVKSNKQPIAVKIPFYQENHFEEIESEGEWIDFYNVSQTEAKLTPELETDDYDFSIMTMENFISSNGLGQMYSDWLNENYPIQEEDKFNQYRFEFLQTCKQYSVYLKWAYRGPGIYRYLNAIKRTAYTGDGENNG